MYQKIYIIVFRYRVLSSSILKTDTNRMRISSFNYPHIKALKKYNVINRFHGEIQSHLIWKRCKSWRIAGPCTFLRPPPLGLTGTCHFYCRLQRDEKSGSARLGSVSIAPRRVFRAWYEHAGLGNRFVIRLSSEGLLVA